jgi:maleylpyruvate isomerase
MIELYDYPRSSAAYRVRIALALKGLDFAKKEVHLLRDGGEHHSAAYKALNPQELVPSLAIDGAVLTQSLAIIEYLDETRPEPALLPRDPVGRARVRAMALSVAAEIHPLQNTRVLNYLRQQLTLPEEQVRAWIHTWIVGGLRALEGMAEHTRGAYCFGDTVTMADICLAPQMVNARRFGCDTSSFPHLVEIDTRLRALPAFSTTTSEVA